MGKFSKSHNHNRRKILILIVLTLLLVLLLISSIAFHDRQLEDTLPTQSSETHPIPVTLGSDPIADCAPSNGTENTEVFPPSIPMDITFPIHLEDGLTITDIGKYAGIFIEDGTDEPVSNILMIQLQNNSQEDLYLATITMILDGKTASFQVTNLPASEQVVLLEQTKMEYASCIPSDIKTENVVFTDKFSMHEDVVRVTALSGVINVENISGTDITDDVFVYYKNYAGGVYLGGITYRIRISGGLKAGEIRQLMASRYHENGSRLLMVSFGS